MTRPTVLPTGADWSADPDARDAELAEALREAISALKRACDLLDPP